MESAVASLESWKDRSIVVYCHVGGRSQRACELLSARGFSKVENLSGGIEGWSVRVDPTLPRY